MGVITLADNKFFPGLVLLYESIQNNFPVHVTCFDGGMNPEQKDWAARHLPNCDIIPIPDNEYTRLIQNSLGGPTKATDREVQLWLCPFLIEQSPYPKCLWLDADTIVIDELEKLFELIDSGPVFTPSNYQPRRVINLPALYKHMPLQDDCNPEDALINAGVSGWNFERDKNIIRDYMAPAIKACSSVAVRQSITWHDQGCLIWAIQNNKLQQRILKTSKWNYCAIHRRKQTPYKLDQDLGQQLQSAYPEANIVHWNDCQFHDKLFVKIGLESDLLYAVSQRLKNVKSPLKRLYSHAALPE